METPPRICKTENCEQPAYSLHAKFCLECKEKKDRERKIKNINYMKARREDPEFREKCKAYMKTKREDPEFREKCRAYIQKKREDPTFKEKELAYQIEYCKKRGIKLGELWCEIETHRDGTI